MVRRFCAVLTLGAGLIILQAYAASVPSSDAMTVRATYAKLVFATRLGEVRENVTQPGKGPRPDASMRLKIVLSQIKTGPLSEIADSPLSDLVTKPSGRVLMVTPGTWNLTTEDGTPQAEIASVAWSERGHLSEDWSVTLGELQTKGVIDAAYTRYASFSVQLSLEGQQRQYQALFLFGKDPDDKEIMLPLDHIIGGSALAALASASSIPATLTAEPFRSSPAAADYVESIRALPNCEKERTGLCCDAVTGHCGVASEDLATHGIAASPNMTLLTTSASSCVDCSIYNTTGPLNGPRPASDQNDHWTGSHSASVYLQGTCTYSGRTPCTGTCSEHVISPTYSDSGITLIYCHNGASSQNIVDNSSGGTCSAAWGAGWAGCFACLPCGVSISISGSGITVGGTSIWSYFRSDSWGPCPPR